MFSFIIILLKILFSLVQFWVVFFIIVTLLKSLIFYAFYWSLSRNIRIPSLPGTLQINHMEHLFILFKLFKTLKILFFYVNLKLNPRKKFISWINVMIWTCLTLILSLIRRLIFCTESSRVSDQDGWRWWWGGCWGVWGRRWG